MRIKLIVLLCIGILCSSSIKDEEGRYESNPLYRIFILKNYNIDKRERLNSSQA